MISEMIQALDDFAWGPLILILLVGTGLYLSIRCGFLQFRKFGYAMKNTIGKIFKKGKKAKAGEVSPFQALTTALAATVGTGNIAGVAGAIAIGGPGAVFWMWISALLGMCTKYAEVVLAVHYREKNAEGDRVGGPMYYIKNGLGKSWKWLAVIFSIFGALAAFGIGNATQVNSIATSVSDTITNFGGSTGPVISFLGSEFTLTALIVGIVVAIIIALVVIKGLKLVGAITEKLVPIMSVIYIVAALAVVFTNLDCVIPVLKWIVKGAFEPSAVVGGVAGGMMIAITKGVSRGCFSNEAGLGSAPIAHAATSEKDPVKQGLYGIFEVFMDTIVICTLSAFVVLIGIKNGTVMTAQAGEAAAASAQVVWGEGAAGPAAAASLGGLFGAQAGSLILAVCLSLFALSTIISWSLYGTRCIEYLSNDNWTVVIAYKVIFVLFTIIGCTLSLKDAWNLADALNGLMSIPNLIALLVLSPVVIKLTRNHFKKEPCEFKGKYTEYKLVTYENPNAEEEE